jgi:UDP:flavonoid glycosyltransferase YjiC (YdhE family)
MRVLATCSLGGAGHLQPLLPVLRAAREQGHETLVVGPPALAQMVEETGHRFEVGDEPPESEVAPIREQLPVAPPAEAAVLGNRELFGRLAARAMLPAVTDVLDRWRPDLVVRDPCEYASAVAAARAGVPVAQVAIGLADVEWASIDIAAPALEEHGDAVVRAIRRAPYLSRFPASLDPSRFADTRRFSDPGSSRHDALPDWWGGSTAPLVYVSFGTVLGHMTMAAVVYRTAIEAVASLDVRVLLTVGHRFEVASLEPLPDNVHVERWVEQSAVLAEAALVVSHGGSGTTFGALAAGLPVVVVPLFADQRANAARIADAAVGLVVDDATGASAATRLRTAIEAVRTGTSYRDSARRVSAEMAGAPTAARRLEALLAGS